MARCLELAQLGQYYVAPNPMVGAILVSTDGRIIAEGWHRQWGGPHAEVNCFADYDEQVSQGKVLPPTSECTMYVSLEPCSHYGKTPPCADLIIQRGVKRVVVGLPDPNPQVAGRGIEKLRNAGIEVEVGMLEQEGRELNKRFLCLHEKKRPYIILKWAQTEDGYMDYERRLIHTDKGWQAEGEPLVISNETTKQLVHKMRAENMAIMVGTRTALLDNPGLKTTRWSGRNPIRIVPDRHDVIPRDSKIFSPDAETIVYKERTDWPYIVEDLARRGIHSVMVEGGAQLLAHILETGLYDEIHVEVGPPSGISAGDGRKGVPAPAIRLPRQPQALIGGNALYEIRKTNQ